MSKKQLMRKLLEIFHFFCPLLVFPPIHGWAFAFLGFAIPPYCSVELTGPLVACGIAGRFLCSGVYWLCSFQLQQVGARLWQVNGPQKVTRQPLTLHYPLGHPMHTTEHSWLVFYSMLASHCVIPARRDCSAPSQLEGS